MDKQREEFEAWLKDCNKHVYDVYKDGYSSSDNVENMCVEWAWSAWQQAQKVAVSEGFVVVPKEPTQTMLDSARDWSTKKYGKAVGNDGASGCYKAMIEAQEN